MRISCFRPILPLGKITDVCSAKELFTDCVTVLGKQTGPGSTGIRAAIFDLLGSLDCKFSAFDLLALDRFEQCLEVAFTETVVALALDELEEDRPDNGL